MAASVSSTGGQTDTGAADSHRLDVFIDLRSPYSYVALSPVRDLAREFGLVPAWRPYAIDVEAAYGAAEERGPRALRKVRYIYKDARRIAAPQGLVIRGPKRIYDPRNAHIALLFARQAGLLDPFLDAIYEGFFSHTIAIEDRPALAALITGLGGSASAYEAFADGPGGEALENEIEYAETLGVFGVPSFAYRGELYWGADRLAMVKTEIAETLDASPSD